MTVSSPVREVVRPTRVAELAGHLVQAAGSEGGELPQRLPQEGQVRVDLRGALRQPQKWQCRATGGMPGGVCGGGTAQAGKLAGFGYRPVRYGLSRHVRVWT